MTFREPDESMVWALAVNGLLSGVRALDNDQRRRLYTEADTAVEEYRKRMPPKPAVSPPPNDA